MARQQAIMTTKHAWPQTTKPAHTAAGIGVSTARLAALWWPSSGLRKRLAGLRTVQRDADHDKRDATRIDDRRQLP
jgi:hypothetical protein